MQRADTIERLRRVYAILRDEGKFTSADAVCCAIAEIERHRAQNVGANEGQWQPIETAPAHPTHFLMWLPGDDDLGYYPTVHVGCRMRTSGEIQTIGICAQMEDDIEPTHWRPLPDAPKCGVSE